MPAVQTYGLIVGSGMADFGGDGEALNLDTRFGAPSAPPRRVTIGSQPVLVLPRHGAAHDIAPHRINYRANLAALDACGVRSILSLNTVGVIPASVSPGSLAVPDQLIDYTWGREHSIRDGKAAALDHVDFTEPFSSDLRRRLLAAAAAAGIPCRDGGVYGVTQGPRLETAAEIDRLERDGVDYVGMTAMPETGIARELGIEIACLSMVVNAAAGRGSTAIHADIEASIAAARRLAEAVLEGFFRG